MHYNRVYWTLLRVLLLLFQHKSKPTIPTLANINAAMILSEDRLFFISNPIGTNDVWGSPSCMETGKFLCKYYISHRLIGCSTRLISAFGFKISRKLICSTHQISLKPHETHLVKPSSSSRVYAIKNNLLIAKEYIQMLPKDTFIHGPFNFATVHNRKTRDCIRQVEWRKQIPREFVSHYSLDNYMIAE